jgi:hypothetical protein
MLFMLKNCKNINFILSVVKNNQQLFKNQVDIFIVIEIISGRNM